MTETQNLTLHSTHADMMHRARSPQATPALREAAQEFEAVYLAEMLKHAGLADVRKGFGGGAGERMFSDLLVREWAGQVARDGGIGLADRLVEALVAKGGPGRD